MTQQLTWREAIDKVLSASPDALHYQDICERIIKAGLRSRLGATPAATVSAQISSAIKHEGQQSPYLRVASTPPTSWARTIPAKPSACLKTVKCVSLGSTARSGWCWRHGTTKAHTD